MRLVLVCSCFFQGHNSATYTSIENCFVLLLHITFVREICFALHFSIIKEHLSSSVFFFFIRSLNRGGEEKKNEEYLRCICVFFLSSSIYDRSVYLSLSLAFAIDALVAIRRKNLFVLCCFFFLLRVSYDLVLNIESIFSSRLPVF